MSAKDEDVGPRRELTAAEIEARIDWVMAAANLTSSVEPPRQPTPKKIGEAARSAPAIAPRRDHGRRGDRRDLPRFGARVRRRHLSEAEIERIIENALAEITATYDRRAE
jgi:hypothetical protein